MSIEGVKSKYPDYESDYAYPLSVNMYNMEVDPSALFSILFVEPHTFASMGVPQKSMKTLNYTFFGDETLLEFNGTWVNITMTIDHS